VPGDSFRILL